MREPIQVVVADDHPIVRATIRDILNDALGIEVVGEARNGAEALELVAQLGPDVLLLDMEMPGLKGVEVARQLQETDSPVQILALSAYDDQQYVRGMLAYGAAGYLLKGESREAIIRAIRGVARGETGWLSRRIAARIGSISEEEQASLALTKRELQIVRLVISGKTDREIGRALELNEEKVKQCLGMIFSKLEVNSRVAMAIRAVEEGLI